MAGHWTDIFSFVGGAVRSGSMAYLAMVGDESAEKGVPGVHFTLWDQGEWYNAKSGAWNLAGIAVVKEPLQQMIAVGEWGNVLCVGSGDIHSEHVERNRRPGKQPKDRGPLRGVRRVGSRIYVVGMDRQAYRRDGARSWKSFGPPGWRELGRQPPGAADVTGFEAVDGFDESDLHAVGWEGEIWNHDGAAWRQLPSPVKHVLVDVCCAGDGMVYACGRQGLLVKGRDQSWEVIDLGKLTQDVWSLAWYGGRLYLATMSGLFTLEGRTLRPVDTGAEHAKTCYRLSAADGVLWSIGAKDVLAFDGKAWMRID